MSEKSTSPESGEDARNTGAVDVVAKDKVVSFHYRLCEVRRDGSRSEWLESSFDSQPLVYLHGYGNVVPGVEEALDGKQTGDEITVTLAPEQAYGYRSSSAALRVPFKHMRRVKNPAKLVPGALVSIDTNKGVKNALVVKVGKFHVDLDTNHPYASRTLCYEIQVKDVRAASAEEIAHGHAHGPGGHQHG